MKIVAIGMIKNATDIIEACARGNSWLIDQEALATKYAELLIQTEKSKKA